MRVKDWSPCWSPAFRLFGYNRKVAFVFVLCALPLLAAGCTDVTSSASHATPLAVRPGANDAESTPIIPELAEEPATTADAIDPRADSPAIETVAATTTPSGEVTPAETTVTQTNTPPAPEKDRTFAVEGPAGALRIGFDDLDLLKLLRMDPVTPDCVDKMPKWLRGLEGKQIRIRGFMKPGLLVSGIPQFLLVRDTGLCCFGPKGKIYDMIAVTLKPGTTTDYIELRPFDVVGTFRIELVSLEEDGTIFGLYYIDDAQIIQK